jgi:hypothetical protein
MYEVSINGYIPRSPNAQQRKHWGRKMDERNFWEAVIARHLWGIQDPTATGRRWVEIELWKPGKIKLRDEDNLVASVKHVLDALVNLHLLVDDNPEDMELRGIYESNGHPRYATHIRFGDAG